MQNARFECFPLAWFFWHSTRRRRRSPPWSEAAARPRGKERVLEHFTPWQSLAGGILIGLSATALLALLGRVAGISGMLGGVLAGTWGTGASDASAADDSERSWRGAFLTGLVAGGAVAAAFQPALFAMTLDRSAPALALAGLLVGFGTRLGSGCTSGHGVCGIARGSTRSISATVTFMATGALTALVITQCFGGRV